MGRGGAIYLSYTALVLLSAITPASAGLWDVNIDLDPAPSPEDGPPFSAHATRNRALLPYQIVGVVASYFGTVLIVGLLLLTVGRRLRRLAQNMEDRPTEMTKPLGAFGQSPFSGQKMWNGSIRSKRSMASSLNGAASPGGHSIMSVDHVVLQRDKERANEQMARMYDALYEQEEQKIQPTVSATELQYANTAPKLSVPRPGRLDLQRAQTTESSVPYSPTTPRSPYHAIYPPQYPSNTNRTVPLEAPRSPVATRPSQRTRATSSSFDDNRTSDSATTVQPRDKQTLRKSIKNLKISAPIQRLRDDDNDDGARTPLSPRFYTNPGAPPEPPSAATLEGQGYPVTPGSTVTADFVGHYGAEVEGIDHVRDVPQAYPQRGTNLESPERRRVANATNNNAILPFRQAQYQQRVPPAYPLAPGPEGWHPSVPLSTTGGYPLQSPQFKTTTLEAPGNNLGGPLTTGRLYSPYMPRVPITPVTPHILSRGERKQRQKEEKALRGAITEEDQVADDKDLWSSGY